MAKKSKMMSKNNKCCSMGAGSIVAHIMLIIGTYVLTWGLIGTARIGSVLKSPVFWGVFIILGAFCCFAGARMKHMHEMCNCK